MLNPSRVEVAAPAPVILIPTYIDLVTAKPPDITTPAVVKLVASVELVKVTKPEALSVVAATEPAKLEAVIVLLLNDSLPAKVARVPVVGSVTLVEPVEVNVILLAPEVANVELLARVNVPVVVVTVKPLTVLFVNASEPANVARVPVVGSVNDVFAVAVNVWL